MMLQDKVAVIYGAGGAIGGAVARAFPASDKASGMTGTTVNLTMAAWMTSRYAEVPSRVINVKDPSTYGP